MRSRSITLVLVHLMALPVLAGPPQRAHLPEQMATLIHVDVDALRGDAFGQELLQSILQLPVVQKHLQTLPQGLAFLRDIRLHNVTVYGTSVKPSAPPLTDEQVILLHAEVDGNKLGGIITLERDYARVSYEGTAVHHWRVNPEALQNELVGREQQSSSEKDEFVAAYLAIPQKGTIVVSPSLRLLTGALDLHRGQGDVVSERRFKHWVGDRSRWFYLAYENDSGEFPTNLVSYLGIDNDGRIAARAETVCTTDEQKMIAQAVIATLSDEEKFKQAFAGMTKKEDNANKDTASPADDQEQTASGKPKRGSFTLGATLDWEGEDKDILNGKDWNAHCVRQIGKMVNQVIQARMMEDRLVITAAAYPGSWHVTLESKDKVDDLRIFLKLFSSVEKRLAAQRKQQSRR